MRADIRDGREQLPPSKGRIQMSKTNYLQTVIFDLQRTAGPYRCANCGLVHRSKAHRHSITSSAVASRLMARRWTKCSGAIQTWPNTKLDDPTSVCALAPDGREKGCSFHFLAGRPAEELHNILGPEGCVLFVPRPHERL